MTTNKNLQAQRKHPGPYIQSLMRVFLHNPGAPAWQQPRWCEGSNLALAIVDAITHTSHESIAKRYSERKAFAVACRVALLDGALRRCGKPRSRRCLPYLFGDESRCPGEGVEVEARREGSALFCSPWSLICGECGDCGVCSVRALPRHHTRASLSSPSLQLATRFHCCIIPFSTCAYAMIRTAHCKGPCMSSHLSLDARNDPLLYQRQTDLIQPQYLVASAIYLTVTYEELDSRLQ